MAHDPFAWIISGGVALITLAILVTVVPTVFWIVEIVDVVRRDFNDDNTKIIWLLVVIFGHLIGALVYYFVGKNQGTLRV